MTNNIYLEALRELVSVFPVPISKYPEACKKVHDALSKKPRNCDVGTADEQVKRHHRHCSINRRKDCFAIDCRKCFAEWAQMPYESEVKE